MQNKVLTVPHINAYLQPSADLFPLNQKTPLFPAPSAYSGNKPIDDGNYLFTLEQKDDFLAREPQAAPYFHQWYGSKEMTESKPRYCLWLGDTSAAELEHLPLCRERIEHVRESRQNSKNKDTRKWADKPTHFHVECFPTTDSLIIPQTSTGNRHYLPIMFIDPSIFASNLVVVVPGATCYHFSILGSHLNMLWTKTVGNTLGEGCRYTLNPVYSNFPWPENPKPELVHELEQAGEAILTVRAAHAGQSLGELYDPKSMPDDLKAAHESCERLVLQAYGLSAEATDAEVIERLCALHRAKVASLPPAAPKKKQNKKGRKTKAAS